MPHVMPVWGVWMDQAFYFSTGKLSRKTINLNKEPRCSVAIVHEKDEESVIVQGEAIKRTDGPLWRRFSVAYKKKYNWDLSSFRDEPFFEVRPWTVFAFSAYGDFGGTATRWTFKRHSVKRRARLGNGKSRPSSPGRT